jgi:hypothetical protein
MTRNITEWALQDSNLRLQPCESVNTLFARQRDATRYHLTSNNDGAGRRKKTAHRDLWSILWGKTTSVGKHLVVALNL